MKTEEERKKFGEDIAFGIQQTAACWATDFIDPVVGEKIQKRFEDDKHHMPPGSTWVGEVAGDTAAVFAFLGVQRFLPSLTRGLKRAVRATMGPLLERTGKNQLARLDGADSAAPGSKVYDEKLEAWKDFQAENIAKTAIISAGSIGFNVGTQKAMGNTHTLRVIALAKVAGAAITVAGMLGLRFVLPKTTEKLDKELSHRYFAPLTHKVQKALGAEVTPTQEELEHMRRQAERREKKAESFQSYTSTGHTGRAQQLRPQEAGYVR